MDFDDLKRMYNEYQIRYGKEAYKHISELLVEAKRMHRAAWEKNPTPARDYDQSWRPWKGYNLEKLVHYILENEVEELGLKIVKGSVFTSKKLSGTLARAKENLMLDFGECGSHLPDLDRIIYNPRSGEVLAVLSMKVTLRERITQTCYWKLAMEREEKTRHIKVFFITLDEDGALTSRKNATKNRAVVESDLDGTYVLTQAELEESSKIKLFEHLMQDLRLLANNQ
ncbi:MAG: BsaWI family type II restriction enzyme [Candidatus Thorarchaeota archaeon]